MNRDADVLVIGAGPAGSSCAIRLARAGWEVVLIEQSAFPRHKVCGECLGAASLQLLSELGLEEQLRELAGPEIRQVGFMTRTRTVIAAMPPCSTGSHRYGRAIGRDRLDALLLEQASSAGVRVIQPARVRAVAGTPGDFACEYQRRSELPAERRAVSERISTPIVIDAHGSWESGPVTPAVTSRDAPRRSERCAELLAFKASFQGGALAPGVLPVLSLPGGYGGMVLADRGRTTVACCVRRDALRESRAVAAGDPAGVAIEAYLRSSCRGVAAALDGARREGSWQAVGPLRLGFNPSSSAGVLRVGNAAVEAHPLIGEGICMALQSAALLAGLLAGKPTTLDAAFVDRCEQRYARECHRAFARRMQWARYCAYIAMHGALAGPLAALMQSWPMTLSLAARLAGKARAATLHARATQEAV
jgi:flavin-dependent dehydrogenase